ncbi:hypothetical protein ACHQM5_025954 [Ranunculus cassubicifolius]
MPRNSLIVGGKCKIRKRGCSSSSSPSSLLQNYRFKRALLINKRGGSSTPVPIWRLTSRSPSASVLRMPESPINGACVVDGKKVKQPPVSARKLAASLWEMNQMNNNGFLEEKDFVKKESKSRDRRSVQSSYVPRHLSDPSHSPVSERMERSGISSHYARTSTVSHKVQQTSHKVADFDYISNASFMETERRSRGQTPKGPIDGAKAHLKDLSNGVATSKELLTVLGRMWGIEEHYSSGKSILSALRAELKRAREHVDYLIQEQHSDHKDINSLMKYFAEEKATWKRKTHERVETAVKSISNDLEMEKKLRRRTESLTKTLGRELTDTKAALANAVRELENEKRAREIMEKVGGELARDIGEDKALVEQLKKESVKVREEVEKEREMLQIADVLREERVHMKLLEAKYQFEEKNAAVNKLRNELEPFLRTDCKTNGCPKCNGIVQAASELINTVALYQNQEIGKGESNRFEIEEDQSSESDLHSIELDMENNNKNYMWNYAAARSSHESKGRRSTESKGRRSTGSGKLTKGRVSLESEGIEWEFGNDNWGDKLETDKQRHKSIKDLRDYIASRLAPSHGYVSPTKQWGEHP